ncbi:MAG TPA: cytochrome d ubiquinol oxidase subunit II [Acidimicrobiales bacterium]
MLALLTASPSGLEQLWFALIGVLWLGYFFLEGFDFGVGILLPFVSRDDTDRRVVVNTIGPVWDGNEVWLLTAGGATFAAFPLWYATVFSGFYLALFLVLAALIFRGMAFELRHRRSDQRWVRWWDRAIFWGSALPALLWGVAFADFVHGVPIIANGAWSGNFFELVKPYALLGGLSTLSLFTLHGATYLGLKTEGDVRARAHDVARRVAPVTFVVVTAFLGWTYLSARSMHHVGLVPPFLPVVGVCVLASVGWLVRERLEGWAFIATALSIVAFFTTLLLNLYPNVLVSSINAAFNLTIVQSASHPYTLKVMSWVALIFTPVVLVYQSWTYWIFKKRVRRPDSAEESTQTTSNV